MCHEISRQSAVIAEFVMQKVEKKALETSPVKQKWWRRYVDDSKVCIKTDCVEVFHSHFKLDKRQNVVCSRDAHSNHGQE